MQELYNYIREFFFPSTVDSIAAPLTSMVGKLAAHGKAQSAKAHDLQEAADEAFDEEEKAVRLNAKLGELFS